ncbi:MAG: fumarylacetoacetate hydrolase family protein [Caulobacteraceae bacterium]|nr:fumarylacetoacetate hydrolase family protein [Caulobacteraceae bacterium]
MSGFVFPPPVQASVPTLGGAAFPVRRILCVGRNYAAHAREMGGDARDPPFFFAKPADAVAPPGTAVPYPPMTHDVHHEVELVAALEAGGSDIPPAEALALVYGYAVGVDLTRRDLQGRAKDNRQPWEAGKAFDASAPIGVIRPWTSAPPQGRIRLAVNGETRQDGRVADMIWSVPEIVAEASRLWRLAPGDLIFTGTPEGVGPLARGDAVAASVDEVGELAFTIA